MNNKLKNELARLKREKSIIKLHRGFWNEKRLAWVNNRIKDIEIIFNH